MSSGLDASGLKKLFPRCSDSFLAANAAGVCDPEPQRDSAPALASSISRKKERPFRARLRITRFGHRLLDPDNLQGGVKPLVDCIKEVGLIWDDSPDWLELDVRQQQVARKDEQRTEIEIIWL